MFKFTMGNGAIVSFAGTGMGRRIYNYYIQKAFKNDGSNGRSFNVKRLLVLL